ncbi:50S ribosomal protein L20 [bacterium HR17]|uniref:Large ribosomal subunit protein bL20 n=1 Tax=Candidatus Fervidibacter japonicus TaxID=2035412 RepID=A0A2H5X9R0_9BACT|nr:50S ribosomal protein L20 [bacterium HR17]
MRVKAGTVTRRRHKKWLKMAEGYWGLKSVVFRRAKEAVIRALNFAYRDRRQRKRDMRRWWIVRINAAARLNGLRYNEFMHGLKLAGITLNRKMLAELAVNDPDAFAVLATKAKEALTAKVGSRVA